MFVLPLSIFSHAVVFPCFSCIYIRQSSLIQWEKKVFPCFAQCHRTTPEDLGEVHGTGSCSSVVVLELFARYSYRSVNWMMMSRAVLSCIIILLNVLGQQRIEKKKKILSDGDVVVSVSSAHRPFCLVKPK